MRAQEQACEASRAAVRRDESLPRRRACYPSTSLPRLPHGRCTREHTHPVQEVPAPSSAPQHNVAALLGLQLHRARLYVGPAHTTRPQSCLRRPAAAWSKRSQVFGMQLQLAGSSGRRPLLCFVAQCLLTSGVCKCLPAK